MEKQHGQAPAPPAELHRARAARGAAAPGRRGAAGRLRRGAERQDEEGAHGLRGGGREGDGQVLLRELAGVHHDDQAGQGDPREVRDGARHGPAEALRLEAEAQGPHQGRPHAAGALGGRGALRHLLARLDQGGAGDEGRRRHQGEPGEGPGQAQQLQDRPEGEDEVDHDQDGRRQGHSIGHPLLRGLGQVRGGLQEGQGLRGPGEEGGAAVQRAHQEAEGGRQEGHEQAELRGRRPAAADRVAEVERLHLRDREGAAAAEGDGADRLQAEGAARQAGRERHERSAAHQRAAKRESRPACHDVLDHRVQDPEAGKDVQQADGREEGAAPESPDALQELRLAARGGPGERRRRLVREDDEPALEAGHGEGGAFGLPPRHPRAAVPVLGRRGRPGRRPGHLSAASRPVPRRFAGAAVPASRCGPLRGAASPFNGTGPP
mmetsp:Transcript_88382/g.250476  ORF Transcript_88382/g.250476 Transcript_88382/m.250476 type:complete len:436 (+) Transcript_88382:144-1451(+)